MQPILQHLLHQAFRQRPLRRGVWYPRLSLGWGRLRSKSAGALQRRSCSYPPHPPGEVPRGQRSAALGADGAAPHCCMGDEGRERERYGLLMARRSRQ